MPSTPFSRPHLLLCCLATVGIALSVSLYAQEPPRLPSMAVRASVYKNGFAVVERVAEVPRAGSWRLDDLPPPAHGTFWVTSTTPGMHVERLLSSQIVRTVTRPLASLDAVARHNPDRWLMLDLGDREVRARVIGRPGHDPAPRNSADAPPDWADAVTIASARTRARLEERSSSQMLVLETEAGTEVVAAGKLRGIRSLPGERPLKLAEEIGESETVLTVETRAAGRLRITYLTAGLTWAPSYRLMLSARGEARLDAKASLLNDVENLEDTEVRFVTGFPDLLFKAVGSPMIPNPRTALPINDFLRALTEQTPGRSGGGSVIAQQAVFASPGSNTSASRLGPNVTPTLGSAGEDFWMQSRPSVTLRRGERAYVDLHAASVPNEEIYRWSIPDRVDERDRWQAITQTQAPSVQHILSIENTSDRPWTTAPVVVERDGLYLAQQVLAYTPAGAKAEVQIGRAVNFRVHEEEAEVGREASIEEPWSGTWDRAEVAGTLTIQSFEHRPARFEIRKSISGEIVDNGDADQVTTAASSQDRHNRERSIVWTRTIPPGETIEIRYRYHVLIRM